MKAFALRQRKGARDEPPPAPSDLRGMHPPSPKPSPLEGEGLWAPVYSAGSGFFSPASILPWASLPPTE
jgi:hypothetical protein